jgi:hypothetical protein
LIQDDEQAPPRLKDFLAKTTLRLYALVKSDGFTVILSACHKFIPVGSRI